MNKRTLFIVQSGIIAALYAALTLFLMPISYGGMQVRISEALTVLPFFTPAAVPGLFIGCLVANFVGPNGIWDAIIGGLATLVAAYFSYKLRGKRFLVPLPPVMINAVVIGPMLSFMFDLPLVLTSIQVLVGELIACYALGYPLMRLLEPYKNRIFKDASWLE